MAENIWLGGTSTAFGTAANWSTGSVPANSGDSVTYDGRAVAACAGSNQSAKTLDVLRHYRSCGFAVGTIASGASPVALQIGATLCDIGLPAPDGSDRMNEIALDFGSAANTTRVMATRNSGTNQLEPVLLVGTHSANKLYVFGGVVGVGTITPGVATTYASIYAKGSRAKVNLGTAVTCGALDLSDGASSIMRSAPTTVKQGAGSSVHIEQCTGTVTTWNSMGTVEINSGITVTTLELDGSAVLNILVPCTITTLKVNSGQVRVNDPMQLATFTNAPQCRNGGGPQCFNYGTDCSVTLAAI